MTRRIPVDAPPRGGCAPPVHQEGSCGGFHGAGSRRRGVKVLQYALALERLEAAFYKQAVSDGGLSGVDHHRRGAPRGGHRHADRPNRPDGTRGITPSGAFDRASTMHTILGEVKQTGFITG